MQLFDVCPMCGGKIELSTEVAIGVTMVVLSCVNDDSGLPVRIVPKAERKAMGKRWLQKVIREQVAKWNAWARTYLAKRSREGFANLIDVLRKVGGAAPQAVSFLEGIRDAEWPMPTWILSGTIDNILLADLNPKSISLVWSKVMASGHQRTYQLLSSYDQAPLAMIKKMATMIVVIAKPDVSVSAQEVSEPDPPMLLPAAKSTFTPFLVVDEVHHKVNQVPGSVSIQSGSEKVVEANFHPDRNAYIVCLKSCYGGAEAFRFVEKYMPQYGKLGDVGLLCPCPSKEGFSHWIIPVVKE